jgi:hypothetical protein
MAPLSLLHSNHIAQGHDEFESKIRKEYDSNRSGRGGTKRKRLKSGRPGRPRRGEEEENL